AGTSPRRYRRIDVTRGVTPTNASARAASAGVTAIWARSSVWTGIGDGPGSGSSLTTPVMIHHTINTPVGIAIQRWTDRNFMPVRNLARAVGAAPCRGADGRVSPAPPRAPLQT